MLAIVFNAHRFLALTLTKSRNMRLFCLKAQLEGSYYDTHLILLDGEYQTRLLDCGCRRCHLLRRRRKLRLPRYALPSSRHLHSHSVEEKKQTFTSKRTHFLYSSAMLLYCSFLHTFSNDFPSDHTRQQLHHKSYRVLKLDKHKLQTEKFWQFWIISLAFK